MRSRFRTLLSRLVAVYLFCGGVPTAHADLSVDSASVMDFGDPSSYVSDQIIVTCDSIESLHGLDPLIEDIVPITEDFQGHEIAMVEIREGFTVEEVLAVALDEPGIVAAQPDYLYSLLETSNDPFLGEDSSWWWLENVKAYDAWDLVRTDGRITVAVLDTGINIYHEDLTDNIDIDHAWDAVSSQPLLTSISSEGSGACGELSSSGHGTHVAGIISSIADNGIGGAGVSYNAVILPVRVFKLQSGNLVSSTTVLIEAFDYLIDLSNSGQIPNLRVVNLSLGMYAAGGWDQLLHGRIQQAQNSGIMTVAAGGNTGRTDPLYPSDWPEVFSVMPIDVFNNKPANYDCNENKDICAPGVGVHSTTYSSGSPANNSYGAKSGSSMAAPVVSGIICLVWAANPALSVSDIGYVLKSGATPMRADSGVPEGIGRVNAGLAVEQAMELDTVQSVIFDGFYTISSEVGNSMVIDVKGASLENGAPITTFTRNHTVAQIFQFIYDTADDCYVIVNPHSQKAIDVPGADAHAGAKLWQHTQNGTDAQKWRLVDNYDGTYTFAAKLNPGLCMDVPGASKNPGALLQLHPINNTPAQKFVLGVNLSTIVPERVYNIAIAKMPSQLIDVTGGSLFDGANIQLWVSNGTGAQRFHVSFDRVTGTYRIINVKSNRCMDVVGGGLVPCTNVWQHVQNDTMAQRWYIEAAGDSYRIYSARSGLALDAEGAGTANNTNVWTFTPNGTPAQDWLLIPVD